MSIPNALAHVDHYGEANLDTITLQHLIENARKKLGWNLGVLEACTDEVTRREWEDFTEDENADNAEAIRRIRTELDKRND